VTIPRPELIAELRTVAKRLRKSVRWVNSPTGANRRIDPRRVAADHLEAYADLLICLAEAGQEAPHDD